MKEIILTLRVLIDEKSIAKKYPNFNINYENTEEGLKEFAQQFAQSGDAMAEFGFSAEVIGVQNADSLEYRRTIDILNRYDNMEYWREEFYED